MSVTPSPGRDSPAQGRPRTLAAPAPGPRSSYCQGKSGGLLGPSLAARAAGRQRRHGHSVTVVAAGPGRHRRLTEAALSSTQVEA